MLEPQAVLEFWLRDVGPKGWYEGSEALDAAITKKFKSGWLLAKTGGLHHWMADAQTALAYLILIDQFPRNMFRGSDQSFATDARARTAAKQAISLGYDMKVAEPERQFFYMPLMHSECLADQERAIRMFLTHMPKTGKDNLIHARAHREVIRQFGRFPFRNAALNRTDTLPETAFMKAGGYRATLNALQA